MLFYRSLLTLQSFPNQSCRQFSSTSRVCGFRNRLKKLQRNVPKYPYGPSYWYKQSNFGLYGGKRTKFGNTSTHKYGKKVRRQWKVNVQDSRLWSKALQRWVRVRLAVSVLRTIDRVGGLDAYVLGSKTTRIRHLGLWGWRLRWQVMQADEVKASMLAEANRLRRRVGLPEELPPEPEIPVAPVRDKAARAKYFRSMPSRKKLARVKA